MLAEGQDQELDLTRVVELDDIRATVLPL